MFIRLAQWKATPWMSPTMSTLPLPLTTPPFT
jgi:hypothetical protein